MPNLETIRRLKVQATSEGVDKATADVNRLANAQEAVVRTSDTLSRRQLSAAGSFDRLKASLDPAFRAQQMYERGQRTLDRALEQGIIEADQYAATLELLRQRQAAMNTGFGQAVPHLNAAAAAGKLNQQQMANMSFQMNDMAVMLASGQNPFMMLMQQGMQISQIFAPGTGVGAALKSVRGAIISFVTNPLNLAVLGFAAVAGGAAALFSAISSGGNSSERVLERHKALVDQITDAYGEAAKAAANLGKTESRAVLGFQSGQDADATAFLLQQQLHGFATGQNLLGTSAGQASPLGPANEGLQHLQAVMNSFLSDIDHGTASVADFRKEVATFASGSADSGVRRLAESWLELTKNLAASEATARQAAALRDLLSSAGSINARGAEADAIVKFNNANADALFTMQRQHAADLSGIGARSPADLAAAARAAAAAQPIDPSESAAVRNYRIEAAGALALAQAQHELSDAYQERMRSLNETVAASQLDLDLVGKSQREIAALRMQHQLLASLREEAARNGIAIDQAEIEAIRKKADEVGRLAEATARAGLLSDTGFERGQMGRSSIEQTVAERMRAIYGDGFGDQMHSFEANQIRVNEQLRIMSDLGKEAVSGFIADIRQGTTVLDALGNALNRVADKLLSMAVDQLWSNAFGGVAASGSGGGLLGSIVSGIGSLLGGGPIAGPSSALTGGIGHAHSGGIIGTTVLPERYVHPAYFDDAPRFHGGGMIGADERPIIAKVGEVVGWPSQMAQAFGGGKMEVHIHPPAGYTATEKRSRTADRGTRLDVAFDEIAAAKAGTRGTALNRAISLSHGSKPQLTRR